MWLHVHHILPVLFQFVLCALHSCASHYILHSECVTVQLQQLREVQTGMLSTCNFGYPSIPNNLIYFWMLFLFPGGCPASLPQSGKKVFCYYEGKKSPHNVDPCPCSHLLYKNVEIEADSQVRLSSQVLEDLKVLKTKKPELAVLLSLGESVVSCWPIQTICVKKH